MERRVAIAVCNIDEFTTPTDCRLVAWVQKKTPGRAVRAGKEGRSSEGSVYEARAARRVVTTGITATFTGLVTLARAVARAMLRALTMKHFSSARSTLDSTSSAFSRITSDISEMISALARSSMRFSRNDRLFDLLRNVRLLSTSAMS